MRVARALRAGEAKLRGHMTIVVGIAGPPGSEYPGVAPAVFRLLLIAICKGFTKCRANFVAANFCDHHKNDGFIALSKSLVQKCMVLKGKPGQIQAKTWMVLKPV